MRKLKGILLAGLGIVAVAAVAHAHEEQSSATFVDSLRKADFVFEGIVTGIEYKSSRPTGARDRPLPHTFVTYEVRRIYKGRADAPRTVTLRFLGGMTDDGRWLQVEGAPHFEVGNRDLLMMERNTQKACPLAGCSQGRFRTIDSKVYTDRGQEVDLTPDGTMAYGPPRPLPEVDSQTIPSPTGRSHVVRHEFFEPNSDGFPAPPEPLPTPRGWSQMSGEQFDAFLVATIKANLSQGELTRLPPVVSADIRQDFHVQVMTEDVPNSDPPGLQQRSQTPSGSDPRF
jgi:hypothetical protein